VCREEVSGGEVSGGEVSGEEVFEEKVCGEEVREGEVCREEIFEEKVCKEEVLQILTDPTYLNLLDEYEPCFLYCRRSMASAMVSNSEAQLP
jgi:hypothetical protein